MSSEDTKAREEYTAFLEEWKEDPLGCKPVLKSYIDLLSKQEGVELSYRCRPGVSYSVRARGKAQHDRDFFVMVDVVDDDPSERWLSICFYADMVTDPREVGDIAPGGLNDEDACCFNYDEADEEIAAYLGERLLEGARAACAPGAK